MSSRLWRCHVAVSSVYDTRYLVLHLSAAMCRGAVADINAVWVWISHAAQFCICNSREHEPSIVIASPGRLNAHPAENVFKLAAAPTEVVDAAPTSREVEVPEPALTPDRPSHIHAHAMQCMSGMAVTCSSRLLSLFMQSAWWLVAPWRA